MEDEVKLGRLPLDDIDGRLLACLSHEPYLTVRSIAQVLGLALATVHRRVTIFLDMKR
jgi:DNA-binding Lrp family transcriptional regulator